MGGVGARQSCWSIVAGAFALLFAGVFLGMVTLITMPFHGAMVRWRANYNPKGVGPSDEDGDKTT